VKFIVTILIMGLVFLAITFSQQNTTAVPITYFDMVRPGFTLPSYLLIFFSFLAGIIIAGLIGMVERFKLAMKASKLSKEIKGLESEIYELRKKALSDNSRTVPPLSDQNLL
jgi:uncharacterized integral membrane protein